MEIHRLHEMLTEAGIEHSWLDRTPECYKHLIVDDLVENPRKLRRINWGYQIVIYRPDGERLISAIEGYGTYGYGGWDHGTGDTDEKDGDLIEIMGLLTPEEQEHDSVVGYLTAEEVFRRIKEATINDRE